MVATVAYTATGTATTVGSNVNVNANVCAVPSGSVNSAWSTGASANNAATVVMTIGVAANLQTAESYLNVSRCSGAMLHIQKAWQR
jgi:hypothetical protein